MAGQKRANKLHKIPISTYKTTSKKHLYPCTVHSVVYLTNTPTNAHIFI